MKQLLREIRRCGFWSWLTSPVFGVVLNTTDCGFYCGWCVIWFDWGERPILEKRFSFGWDID